MSYFEETIEKLTSLDKNVLIIGDFHIDLLKCETSRISHDFLMSLQSRYLIPTVDESTRGPRYLLECFPLQVTVLDLITTKSDACRLLLVSIVWIHNSEMD